MRCQTCDYELWHCTGRTCPECGSHFSLNDYDFQEEIVLFHCPHCDHGIEGCGPKSIPLDHLQQCESCGLAIGLNLFIVRPVGGVRSESSGGTLPLHRKTGNWFSKYFATIWLVMSNPTNTIARVPVHEPLWHAWKFFLTTYFVTILIGLIPSVGFIAITQVTSPNSFGLAEILLIVFFYFIAGVILISFYAILWALLTHVLLQVTGGSTFTLRRTMQSILYGGGSSISSAVPCIGGVMGMIWWLVSAINMVAKGQRVGGGRATFATMSGPVLVLTCVCGGYAFLVFSVMQPALTRARSAAQRLQQQSSQVVPTPDKSDASPLENPVTAPQSE